MTTIPAPSWRVYLGDGSAAARHASPADPRGVTAVPPPESTERLRDPAGYLADPGLRDAVNVALLLGQPLLLTGAPGTGKTTLADSVAYELGLPRLTFNTKTTSVARDLFYQYDVLARFHDSQFPGRQSHIDDYLEYQALGVAILLAMEPAAVDPYLPPGWADRYLQRVADGPRHSMRPIRSVVLIDEVDKAPRDMPNDVLNEIERMSFSVREKPNAPPFTADQRHWPIVILTSNSEKNLPDAFLRRCVYYHLPRLEKADLARIVRQRLQSRALTSEETTIVDAAVDEFLQIRELTLTKPPATAELIAWVTVLLRLKLNPALLLAIPDGSEAERDTLAFTYSVLAKTPEDLKRLRERAATRRKG